MKGYRKISTGFIEVNKDEVAGEDLNDGLIKEINHEVTGPIMDCAEKTGNLEYMVVIYKKVP